MTDSIFIMGSLYPYYSGTNVPIYSKNPTLSGLLSSLQTVYVVMHHAVFGPYSPERAIGQTENFYFTSNEARQALESKRQNKDSIESVDVTRDGWIHLRVWNRETSLSTYWWIQEVSRG
jgi:hypothetical protein